MGVCTAARASQNYILIALYSGLWMIISISYAAAAVISCRYASVRVQCSVWARVLSYLASFIVTNLPWWLYLHFEAYMVQHVALRIASLTLFRLSGFCTVC